LLGIRGGFDTYFRANLIKGLKFMGSIKHLKKIILLLIVVLVFLVVMNLENLTNKIAPKVDNFGQTTLVKIAGIEIGAFVGTNPPTSAGIEKFEEFSNQNLYSIMWFQGWDAKDQPTFPNSELNKILSARTNEQPYVLHLTWEPAVDLKDISQGAYDSYIKAYAESIKDWNKEVRFRFAHEMIEDNIYDGNEAYRWQDQPEDYVNAFRHIHNIFSKVGANNAKFVWCPNNFPVDVNIVKKYYPGIGYVDWLCMDGYNWGNQDGTPEWPEWLWFDDIFANMYHTLVDHPEIFGDKPIMIGEFASCEAGEHDLPGQNKAEWIKNAFERIASPDFQKIKAFHWFQINKECDWRVDSSDDTKVAFKAALKQNSLDAKLR
jgi:beta-mannanase